MQPLIPSFRPRQLRLPCKLILRKELYFYLLFCEIVLRGPRAGSSSHPCERAFRDPLASEEYRGMPSALHVLSA